MKSIKIIIVVLIVSAIGTETAQAQWRPGKYISKIRDITNPSVILSDFDVFGNQFGSTSTLQIGGTLRGRRQIYLEGTGLTSNEPLSINEDLGTNMWHIESGTDLVLNLYENTNVGIGKAPNPLYKLDVDGTIHADNFKLDGVDFADYTFSNIDADPEDEKILTFVADEFNVVDSDGISRNLLLGGSGSSGGWSVDGSYVKTDLIPLIGKEGLENGFLELDSKTVGGKYGMTTGVLGSSGMDTYDFGIYRTRTNGARQLAMWIDADADESIQPDVRVSNNLLVDDILFVGSNRELAMNDNFILMSNYDEDLNEVSSLVFTDYDDLGVESTAFRMISRDGKSLRIGAAASKSTAGNYLSQMEFVPDGPVIVKSGRDHSDPSKNLFSSSLGNVDGSFGLLVQDGIVTEDLAIATTDVWGADYVFEEAYELTSLAKLESYVTTNKHLPGVVGAPEAIERGIYDVDEMIIGQLRNLEEQVLHNIAQEKMIREQAQQLKVQAEKLERLERLVNKLLKE